MSLEKKQPQLLTTCTKDEGLPLVQWHWQFFKATKCLCIVLTITPLQAMLFKRFGDQKNLSIWLCTSVFGPVKVQFYIVVYMACWLGLAGDRSYTCFMTKKCRLLCIETCKHALMEETDKDKFESLLTRTVQQLQLNNSTEEFGQYFKTQLCGQKTWMGPLLSTKINYQHKHVCRSFSSWTEKTYTFKEKWTHKLTDACTLYLKSPGINHLNDSLII